MGNGIQRQPGQIRFAVGGNQFRSFELILRNGKINGVQSPNGRKKKGGGRMLLAIRYVAFRSSFCVSYDVVGWFILFYIFGRIENT